MALNERMIRSLFDESPLVMLILDPDNGRILDVSNKAVDFYGYPKEKLVSLTLKDLQISPPVEMREMFNLTPSIQKGFHRLQHRLADGSTREVEICSGTVHFEQREVELMFVVDITRQIRSIERTRASLREREDILQTAMDGFWIVDEHSIIREVNSAYCSLSGYLPEELVDEKLGKFDCRKETHSLYFESGPYGEASRFETQHRTKDGQILDLEVSVRKSTTQENRVYVFFRDVTADKAAKDRMQMLSACLAATENTVVISDPEQRIEWVNDAFCRISGYRKDEAYGKATAEIFKPGQESHAAAERMKQARQRGDAWRGELTNLRKDGTPYTVDATLTPLKNERDEVIRYIGILQDITEKKKLERLYLRSQRMETVGSLTSGIAHDLNNILSPILMSAEMLTASVTNPEHVKLAEIIFQSADRGGQLLKQLLGFARGTSAEKQILPIGPLVKETFKMYRETFPKNIDMQISLSADLPSVAVNPGQISQVLGNVIVNARDAMPGGGSLFLEVSMEEVGPEWAAARPYARTGSFIRIRIQDTGSGIAPEYQDKIFEPFFTTKPSGKGTGLGLATCLNIVKGHNGFIDLTSSEEQGTKVDLFLPVSDAPPQRQTTNPMKAASAYRSGKGRHLVVVDDEKAVRTIVSTALETMDYTLHPFSSGQEALDFLSKHPEVDLVLLDVEMPGMNGKEVVWEMDRRRLEIPVLFITGLKEESNEPQIDFRGRPVLMKPFTLDELRKAVETHLKSKTT
jgi:PAS domain S-box-containing protein